MHVSNCINQHKLYVKSLTVKGEGHKYLQTTTMAADDKCETWREFQLRFENKCLLYLQTKMLDIMKC